MKRWKNIYRKEDTEKWNTNRKGKQKELNEMKSREKSNRDGKKRREKVELDWHEKEKGKTRLRDEGKRRKKIETKKEKLQKGKIQDNLMLWRRTRRPSEHNGKGIISDCHVNHNIKTINERKKGKF